MKRVRNITAVLAALLFSLSIAFSGISAAAKAVPIPTPVVSGLESAYMLGNKILIGLTATGTSNLVQYKVVVTNDSTKKSVDLLKGFTPKYYNPKYSYKLSFMLADGGNYTLSVTAKPGGYKNIYSKTVTKKFKVISNSDIIEKIPEVSGRVNIGDKYELPDKVEAVMKDGSKKLVDVKWDDNKIDTSVIEVKTFYGSTAGYDEKVVFTLNIVDEKIISIDPVIVAIDEGEEFSLPEKVIAKVNNGTISVNVKWDDIKADTNKPGTYKYEGKVDGFDGKALLTLTVKPVTLKVNTIDSSNLKEIKIKFNKHLDMESIMEGSFKLFKGTNLVLTKVRLLEDNKTAAISLASAGTGLDNKGNYVLIIEGIKDLNGNEIQREVKDVVPTDTDSPKVKNISILGPSIIEIEFSEPVKSADKNAVTIKSGSSVVHSNPPLSGFDTSIIRVELNYALYENIKYEISVKGFKDFSGKESVLKVQPIASVKDNKPIKASIVYAKEAYVALRFNKEVRGITKEHFYNSIPGRLPIGIYKDSRMVNEVKSYDRVDTIWVKFYDISTKKGYPFYEEGDKLYILGTANKISIKDNWGNVINDASIHVGVKGDKKAPEVVDIKAETESSLIVTFSEKVKFNISNIEIIDDKGLKAAGVTVRDIDGIKYRVGLGKDYKGHRITVNIKNVEDMAIIPNKLEGYSRDVEVTDKTPPQVVKVVKKFITGMDQSLYFYFNEALDESSLTISNYAMQNPTSYIMSKLSGKPEFVSGSSVVRVPITDEEKKMIESGYHVFVSDICDLEKNVLLGQVVINSNIKGYNSSDNKPKVERIEAVDKRTVEITFNQYLTRIDKESFMVNGEAPVNMRLSINDEGNTVVTLTASGEREFQTDLSGLALVNIISDSSRRIENDFGLCVDSSFYTPTTSIRIEDKMPPAVKYVNEVPQIRTFVNTSGVVDCIVVEYEENIDMTKLSALSYSVFGRSISRVYTNHTGIKGISAVGKFVVIELKPVSIGDNPSSNPVVTQVLDIYDMNDNKLSPTGQGMIPADNSGAYVVERITGQIARGETRYVRFSKPLNQISRIVVENMIRTASGGRGTLVFTWTNDSALSITNVGIETTNFNLTSPIKVNITDTNGNTTVNVTIIGY